MATPNVLSVMLPRLSICVPTYNRAEFIAELLASIARASEGLPTSSIEVAISDNASFDGTEEVVDSWRSRLRIAFARCPVNKGPDRNFFNAACIASAPHVWLMGSDDAITPDGLRRVLADLAHPAKPDIHVYDRIDCSRTMRATGTTKWSSHGEGTVVGPTGLTFAAYLDGCRDLGGGFSFLSSLVVSRAAFLGVELPSWAWTSGYSHAVALQVLMAQGGVAVIHRFAPVFCRHGNDSFLEQGVARRMLLDLDGYLSIAQDPRIPATQAEAIRNLLRRTHSWVKWSRALGHVQGETDILRRLEARLIETGFRPWNIRSFCLIARLILILDRLNRIRRDLLRCFGAAVA